MQPFHTCSCLEVPAACIQVNPRKRAFGYDEYWEIIDYHVQITRNLSLTTAIWKLLPPFMQLVFIIHRLKIVLISNNLSGHTRPYHGRDEEQLVYWEDQLLRSTTIWWPRFGQDVWGGITRFVNSTPIHFYSFIHSWFQVQLQNTLYIYVRWLTRKRKLKVESYDHIKKSRIQRSGLLIQHMVLPSSHGHISLINTHPSHPPKLFYLPLMLHNLGLSACFWWNVTTAIYTKPRSKTSGF